MPCWLNEFAANIAISTEQTRQVIYDSYDSYYRNYKGYFGLWIDDGK